MFSKKRGKNKYTIDNIGPGSTTSTFSYPMTGIVSVTLFSDNYVSANIELSKCSTYKITVNGSSISFIESEN
ncbi:MAG: hypothetical protein HC905_22115 [Bacteroidales bacterium]|nr:hypothetical protein [Bacteroidales bacterium]